MIYDADTWIGHWPFRALPDRFAAALLREMDRHGIERALVGSLHGLFYKDAHEANRELAREVARHRDRLVPCALLNPTYYGWRADLIQCREVFGMPVLRLAPHYHGYALADRCAAEIVEAAHELKMRVALIGRVVDPRGRHRLDPGREADGAEVAAFLRRFPKAAFLLLNFYDPPEKRRWDAPFCLLDMVRFTGLGGLKMSDAVKEYGADRFCFGSTLLLRGAKSALLTVETADLTKAQREAVLWRNLARLVPELRQ